METEYEWGLLASFLLNACRAWKTKPAFMSSLSSAVDNYSSGLGLTYRSPLKEVLGPEPRKSKNKARKRSHSKLTAGEIKMLEQHLERVVKRYTGKPKSESYAFLAIFLDHLGFEPLDQKICELAYLSSRGGLEVLLNYVLSDRIKPTQLELISALLGEDKQAVYERLKFSASLLKSGILYRVSRDFDGVYDNDHLTYYLHGRVLDCLDSNECDLPSALDHLIGKTVLPETEWSDFEHVKTEADFAAGVLESAVEKDTQGVNILIYGDTGTGKTELARALAAHLNLPLFAVGEKPDMGDDTDDERGNRPLPSPAARLADKRLVENLLGRRKMKALTAFDEMEDVVQPTSMETSEGARSSFQMSKSATNDLLTKNKTPCIWMTNNIGRYDRALLRRFSFVIELKTPNTEVRQRVISRTLQRYGRTLTESAIRDLAIAHAVPPAFFNKAIETAGLPRNVTDEFFLPNVKLCLRNIGRLVIDPSQRQSPKPVNKYDLSLTNTDHDLAYLTARIVANGHKNFSICGYGISGAGKSEFLIFLAQQMGLDALVIHYSDIADTRIGVTEQNIGRAYEQAADEQKFLIFNEAEDVLMDRRTARNSWERSGTNEMLTRMERHPFPLGCTTNLGISDGIDPAALRRFTFKICFKGLKPKQARRIYRTYFEHDLPENMSLPDTIAPGDFENVAAQARTLGTERDGTWLVGALKRECDLKGARRPIGFGTRGGDDFSPSGAS